MNEVASGKWGVDVSWKLYETSTPPKEVLVTAVFCVAIHNNQVVLARSKRGWGLIGGHVEDGETLIEALHRESLEEGGFIPKNPVLFACMEITSTAPVKRPHDNSYYPFPKSYQLYYTATTNQSLVSPTGREIIECGKFDLEEAMANCATDSAIIELGFKAFSYQR